MPGGSAGQQVLKSLKHTTSVIRQSIHSPHNRAGMLAGQRHHDHLPGHGGTSPCTVACAVPCVLTTPVRALTLYTRVPRRTRSARATRVEIQLTRSIRKMLGPFATASRFTLPFTRCRYCRTPPLSHCASMSTITTTTITTTTTCDRGDRYGPTEWAQ